MSVYTVAIRDDLRDKPRIVNTTEDYSVALAAYDDASPWFWVSLYENGIEIDDNR